MRILVILICSILLVLGQVFWKLGLDRLGIVGLFNYNLFELLLKVIKSPLIIIGIIIYGLATLLWLYILAYNEFSKVYPMLAISYVLGFIIGIIFFNETFNLLKILGLISILVGFILLALTK